MAWTEEQKAARNDQEARYRDKDPERYKRLKSAALKRYRERDPERYKRQKLDTYERHRDLPRRHATQILCAARTRAKKHELAFDLDKEWIVEKLTAGACEISGISFQRHPAGRDTNRAHALSPSLDRIVPELGYVKSNLRMVCFAVNQARSDYGDEVLLMIAQAIVSKFRG